MLNVIQNPAPDAMRLWVVMKEPIFSSWVRRLMTDAI
jgi:hypothetical protein